MLKELKILRVKLLVYGVTIEESTNNGKLFMLIRLIRLQQKD